MIKNTAIFALGSLGTKIISFFMVPLYTNVLTTEQYGIVDLVATISTIVVPILSLNIAESVMRFDLDKGADKDENTKIGLTVLFFGCVAGMLLIPILRLFDKVADLRFLVYFYIIFLASRNVLLYDLRGKEFLFYYSIGNILQTLLIAGLNIVFLVVFDLGICGYLLAYILSFAITAAYAFVVGKCYKAIKVPLNRTKMAEMLKYSIVLIPSSLMWWVMDSSDRIMVTVMVGAAANGIYAVSYKLPTLIATFTSIFTQAWSYSAIKEEGADDEEEYNNRVYKKVVSISMLIGIAMLCVIKPFLTLYVSESYRTAWKYTPFLIVGMVYLTLGSFMATSYTVHKDSFGHLASGSLGALLNIGLNFALIPLMRVYGAAIATCTSYIVVFIFRAFHTKKYIRYEVMNAEFVMGTVLLLLSAGLIYSNSFYAQLMQIGCVLVALLVYKSVWKPYLIVFVKRIRGK